ncbi:hypothetical protein RJ639_037375 [Escallonia herrerae]|uniref:Uncharacterized protein n=1 Tax=Escallonia herrerae TaxID=1293975 RepID=A0AA88WQF5_9ASTE|nr:hypothetical protein RJ639_037375 [Escallonia herrerae]
MSLTSQNLLNVPHSRISFYFNTTTTTTTLLKTHNFPFKNSPQFQILKIPSPQPFNFRPIHTHMGPLKAYESGQSAPKPDTNIDAMLSLAEFLCLASSAVVSIGFAVNSAASGTQKPVFVWLGSRVLAWQCVLLVGGVVVGAVIRRRQWKRVCGDFSRPGGGSGVNLLERIEKLEEDLKSSATIIRVLSRQLEKLGIRFRVTRKALKDPIAETTALAQKNSEATRALAVQEDILEKELGEIQKVLLAMQEQQQKQLELILAIGKTGKLWESRREPSQDQAAIETANSAAEKVKQMVSNPVEALVDKSRPTSTV